MPPPIGFRPIQPDDAERLTRAFEQLSPTSRYRRFHAPNTALTEADRRGLSEVDFVDHVAWVAELICEPGRPFAGVGRWIRLRGDPTVAEIALTVVDAYQRQGLGMALLKLLGESALAGGVRWFEATVLGENHPMRSLLSSVGARQVGYDMGAYVYRLPVAAR
jgi:RimJ/RimL family protein N-acetyltransferase